MFNIDPGQEYAAVVEFAPFQKISKKKLKKKDAKAGSIEEGTVLTIFEKKLWYYIKDQHKIKVYIHNGSIDYLFPTQTRRLE